MRPWNAIVCGAVLAIVLASPRADAQGEATRVVVVTGERGEAAIRDLRAELASAGFAVLELDSDFDIDAAVDANHAVAAIILDSGHKSATVRVAGESSREESVNPRA